MVSYAFRDVNVTSGDIRAHISGDTVVLASGQEVIVSISGQQIDFVSGIAIALSGLNVITTIPNINVNVGSVSVNSGLGVIVQSGISVIVQSGLTAIVDSGLGVIIQSGINVISSPNPSPTVIRARSPIMVSDSSGGVILSSGQTREVTIRALDGDIYVGSPIGNDMPYSGCGVLVQQGDTASIPIDNFNNVAVFATVSGNRVSFGGVY